MSTTPPDGVIPPPESKLIAEARKRLWPNLTMARAAQLAGISPSRWRNIENGWRWVGKGTPRAETTPAPTLAAAARVVDLKPRDLIRVGRHDAAKELDQILRVGNAKVNLAAVTDADLLAEVQRRMSATSRLDPLPIDTDHSVQSHDETDGNTFSWN